MPEALSERIGYFFNPWLTTDDNDLLGIQRGLAPAVFNKMDERKERTRARKEADSKAINRIILTVLANFAAAMKLHDGQAVVAVLLGAKRGKASRYDAKGFGQLADVLEALEAAGALTLHKSSRFGVASRVEAAAGLLFRLSKVPHWRIKLHEQYEPVVVSRATPNYARDRREVELIEYEDTDETRLYRSQVKLINDNLERALLRFEDDGGIRPDLSRVHLARIFNAPAQAGKDDSKFAFDRGGRLYHGWWQDLAKERRSSIRIGSESVADLDFASMAPRLAYLRQGVKPPPGDLYASIGELSDPQWRDGVKRVVSALLFRTDTMVRLPKDTKGQLPKGMTAERFRELFLQAHPDLKGAIETGLGFELMFTESQILIAALLKLIDQKITALPMHDGLMVARSKSEEARKAMREAAIDIVGFDLPITLKS